MLQKKKADSDDESDVAMVGNSDDEFDALVASKPAAPREKPGRRAASKVKLTDMIASVCILMTQNLIIIRKSTILCSMMTTNPPNLAQTPNRKCSTTLWRHRFVRKSF